MACSWGWGGSQQSWWETREQPGGSGREEPKGSLIPGCAAGRSASMGTLQGGRKGPGSLPHWTVDQHLTPANAPTVTSPRVFCPGDCRLIHVQPRRFISHCTCRRMGEWEDQQPSPGRLCGGRRVGVANGPLETAWPVQVIPGSCCAGAIQEQG